ncbi:MAG: short-chain dehydrogenase/reductase, partial [Frankiales bacterium]|nr:short-chain dehydrogenase/reductase [Frankiales bacterium]
MGRTALVTGGGTGIGFACASALQADGYDVVIAGRTEDTLKKGVERLGGSASYVVADVTDEASVEAAVAEAAGRGDITAVVANAGGGGMLAPTHTQDLAEFTRVLHQNVLGTVLIAKHTLPHLVRTSGTFLGMSSLAGHVTHRWFGAYPVAKAGIEELVKNIADEYGPAGVRANSIRPGFTATELMEGIPRDSDIYRSYLEKTQLGGVAEPEDDGNLAAFQFS